MDYDYKQICYSLKKVGIKKRDVIYLTGDLSLLGAFKDKKKILSEFYKALKKALGKNGTIAFPTHSFYVKGKEIYDPKKTISKTGVVPEFLRKQKNAVRQDHPYASVTSLGKWAKYISANNTNDSWGEKSPFDRLIKLKAKVLNFGLIPRLCSSSVHHAEQMAQVPYRFKKKFIQKVKVKNKIISKPTSCKKYNIGHYYISTMPRGKQTHTELLPKKVELYNIIDDKYTIEKIIIYSKYTTHDLRHSLRFTEQYHSTLINTLDFIAIDCEKMLDCYMLTYLPKQKHVIDISGHYEINLSDFNISDMLDHPISSTNDLHIVCSI